MSRPVTSFQKKPRGVKRIEIPGTKPSIHNNQLLISTGIPSLDFHLGGGVAVGTLILIEEDSVGSFANLMLRYFIAEGLVCGHSLFLAAKDSNDVLRQIPEPILHDSGNSSSSTEQTTSTPEDDEELKIAWRYKDVNKAGASGSCAAGGEIKFGHYFDLNRCVDASVFEGMYSRIVDLSETLICDNETISSTYRLKGEYRTIMEECTDFLNIRKNLVSSQLKPEERNICRIAIHAAGSPLWDSSDPFSLSKFLFCLKHSLRQSFSCAVVTVPSKVISADKKVAGSLRHLADYAFKLRSFAGTDDADNPALKDYHGLFQLVKLPRLNSLIRFNPSTYDLAFKLRRKRFTVEKLHLPPDLAETVEREQDETSMKSLTKKKSAAVAAGFSGGCGGKSGGLSALDF